MHRTIPAAVSGALVGALYLTPALAAHMDTTLHCQDLVRQFNSADKSGVGKKMLQQAKDQAARGEKLCVVDPEGGVRALERALIDIGVAAD